MRRPMPDWQLVFAVETISSELEANSDRAVQLRDIAAGMGLSERTLRHRFAARVGMSPMRYLRQRRLMMAQEALQQASAHAATVTGVALSCRFSELGRFSVAYRRLFGESPSVTLRRSGNHTSILSSPLEHRKGASDRAGSKPPILVRGVSISEACLHGETK